MRLYDKSDLVWSNGYITDQDGSILNSPELVSQVNAWAEMTDANMFVNANREDIEKSGKIIRYERLVDTTNKITFAKLPTPTLDKQVKKSAKVFEEIEKMETAAKANEILNEKLGSLVAFVMNDKVLLDPTSACSKQMLVNPLGIIPEVLTAEALMFFKNKDLIDKLEVID